MIQNTIFAQFDSQRQNIIQTEVEQLQAYFQSWINQHQQNSANNNNQNEIFQKKQLIFQSYINQLNDKINSQQNSLFQFQTITSIRSFFDNLKQLLIAETKIFDEIQAFNSNENENDKRGHKFSKKANYILKKWFISNYTNPFPSDDEIKLLAEQGELSQKQVKIWFINARGRIKNKFYMNKKFKNIVKEKFFSLNSFK